ncbi:hypothetical protein GH714_025958 [Hevea brasiliensis]|uniref:PPM-type phosphatase domain-containing protein n=1 Tax=Hevea brasiliensis TaxID=3981 RepID=A0A6A6LVD1_HEVBR|nr:hypothetical protein GH714_025958 [Hevea brasiliensis]
MEHSEEEQLQRVDSLPDAELASTSSGFSSILSTEDTQSATSPGDISTISGSSGEIPAAVVADAVVPRYMEPAREGELTAGTPDRQDELMRIEGVGGKVISWNGARVFGVLAMSRAIGDRYLRPSIIPVPEITFMTRTDEDECLILASDGLWDVMQMKR